MRISGDKLASHLEQKGLLPIYLIGGDEPLLQMECTDLIRNHARNSGAERTVLNVEPGFDWNQVLMENANPGLFSSIRLIELRLAHYSPGKPGGKMLTEYAENPSPDSTLMITMDKLDKRMLASQWCKAIDRSGGIVQLYPVDAAKLPAWISRRASALGKQLNRDAADLIAQRTEGNLLATQQELEKLALLLDKEEITVADIQECVTDSTRYDVFKLIEYALNGHGIRIISMLRGLRQEGVEPISVYGAIMWEVRRICSMAAAIAQGIPRDRVFNEHRVWYQRQSAINSILDRFSTEQLGELLHDAIHIDQSMKGVSRHNPWELLERFLLKLGGIRLV